MYFLDTQMHVVTFGITVFEMLMFLFQIVHFLQRPGDKNRLLYLVLLIFLILHNLCSGLFPDDNIPLPVMLQNVIAYLVGFAMSIYFVYYFYKAFDLVKLKFFAFYGSILFLFLPFALLFLLPYYLTGNLELGRRLTVIIPFLYGLAFIGATTRAFILKIKKNGGKLDDQYDLIFTAYIALLCWAALPVIVFFGDFQVLEHSITNAGFLMMTIIYVRSSIKQAKVEYSRLILAELNVQQVTERNYEKFKLTPREIEITNLIRKGRSYKIIGYALNISEKTVARHVSNIFGKVSATNKVELINKLESREA